MPQPYQTNNRLDFSPEAFLKRPHLATLIALMNAEWARIDFWVAVILVRIIAVSQIRIWMRSSLNPINETDLAMLAQATQTGARMYLSLSGSAARDALLEDTAKNVLPEDELKRFGELMKEVRSIRKRRNRIAHGIIGIDPDISDAIVVQDLEDAVTHAMQQSFPNCYMYKEKDLLDLGSDIRKLTNALDAFNPKEFSQYASRRTQPASG